MRVQASTSLDGNQPPPCHPLPQGGFFDAHFRSFCQCPERLQLFALGFQSRHDKRLQLRNHAACQQFFQQGEVTLFQYSVQGLFVRRGKARMKAPVGVFEGQVIALPVGCLLALDDDGRPPFANRQVVQKNAPCAGSLHDSRKIVR